MQNFGVRRVTDFRKAKWSTITGRVRRTLPVTPSIEEVPATSPCSPLKATAYWPPVASMPSKPVRKSTCQKARRNSPSVIPCSPAATYLHMRGGRKVVDRTAYPDMDEFWADVARAYQEEIADLAAAGCTYLQLDDVSFAFLCDEGIRDQVRRDGEDPDALPGLYARIINSLIAKRPAGMAVTVHTCRGNHRSMWMAEGGYEPVAEAAFSQLEVDGIFLEYDTERSGGFEPLRFLPKGRRVVLGLVSTKRAALESKDTLKRRIDEAAKFVDLQDLCLSPQCGFASTDAGNELTADDEKRKLAMIAEVAEEVWGAL